MNMTKAIPVVPILAKKIGIEHSYVLSLIETLMKSMPRYTIRKQNRVWLKMSLAKFYRTTNGTVSRSSLYRNIQWLLNHKYLIFHEVKNTNDYHVASCYAVNYDMLWKLYKSLKLSK